MSRRVLDYDGSGKFGSASLPRGVGRVAAWESIRFGSANGWRSRPGARKSLPHFAIVARNSEYLSQLSLSFALWFITVAVNFCVVFGQINKYHWEVEGWEVHGEFTWRETGKRERVLGFYI